MDSKQLLNMHNGGGIPLYTLCNVHILPQWRHLRSKLPPFVGTDGVQLYALCRQIIWRS